ncbi:nucleotidyltransferase family protein [Shewanella gaetbuli]
MSPLMPRLAIVVLAAGRSSRFNGIKQLASLTSQHSLLSHTLTIIKTVQQQADFNIPHSGVIVGANKHKIIAHITELERTDNRNPVDVVVNEQWHQGLSHSVHCAVSFAIQKQCSALMLVLADQIALTHEDFLALLKAFQQNGQTCCAEYEQQLGVPAIFTQQDYSALLALKGDSGAKKILIQKQQINTLNKVALPYAGIDIDTKADLQLWQANKE